LSSGCFYSVRGWQPIRARPADCPQGAYSSSVRCVSISRRARFLLEGVWDHPHVGHGPSAQLGLSADPSQTVRFSEVWYWRFCSIIRTVRPNPSDRPPTTHGLYASGSADWLSPLPLELCFRFGLCLDLFLRLVGLL
jgi:hypothetical protein